MKKRITALALAFAMVLGTTALAAGGTKTISVTPMELNINGQTVTPTKSDGTAAEAFSYEGATYLPMRYLCELLGITVDWDKNAPDVAKLVSDKLTLPAAPTGTKELKDGSYTGTGRGNNGSVKVSVTVSGGAITAVNVTEHAETTGISDPAIERIPAAIVADQSVAVDTVSGATNTSNAILTAVKDCITQAGGSVEAWSVKEEKEASTKVEEYTADVVVVGGGGSGSAAAMAANDQGAKVILIEKAARVGGSSAMSGGMAALNSSLQKADPTVDFTASQWLKDWLAQQNYMVSGPMIYKFITESGETVDWLMDKGVVFDFVGHHQEALADSPFKTYHKWAGNGLAAALSSMLEGLADNGGQVMTETTGVEVLMENGHAAGVVATRADGTTVKIHAKSVVLATGGYGASGEEMERVLGYKANGINSGGQTGDGIRMGIAAGAATEGYTNVEFHGAHSAFDLIAELSVSGDSLNHMAVSPSALWVNVDGYRFTNEDICYDSSYIGNVTAAQGDHYYVLVDQHFVDTLANKGEIGLGVTKSGAGFGSNPPAYNETWPTLKEELEAGLANGVTVKADTLEELAEKAGINAKNLVDTVETYNAACAAGVDDMYSKESMFMVPVKEGPYYLIMGRTTELCSLGGLKITTGMEVVDENNQVIPGLYSAGVDCSGSMYNNAYVSYEGVTMGWVMTSGRLAGENAGAYAKK